MFGSYQHIGVCVCVNMPIVILFNFSTIYYDCKSIAVCAGEAGAVGGNHAVVLCEEGACGAHL